MTTLTPRARLGLYGTVALVLVLLLTQRLDALAQTLRGGDLVTAYFTDSTGLSPGDRVEVSGIAVGRVTSVEIDVLASAWRRVSTTRCGSATARTPRSRSATCWAASTWRTQPAGSGKLDGAIPLSRTTPAYDVVQAVSDLSDTVEEIDTAQLATALDTVASTFRGAAPDVRRAVAGVSRLSRVVASRDQELRFAAERHGDRRRVAGRQQGVAVAVRPRGEPADGGGRPAAGHDQPPDRQLLVAVTRSPWTGEGQPGADRPGAGRHRTRGRPACPARQDKLARTVHNLATFARVFVDTIGSGPWFDSCWPTCPTRSRRQDRSGEPPGAGPRGGRGPGRGRGRGAHRTVRHPPGHRGPAVRGQPLPGLGRAHHGRPGRQGHRGHAAARLGPGRDGVRRRVLPARRRAGDRHLALGDRRPLRPAHPGVRRRAASGRRRHDPAQPHRRAGRARRHGRPERRASRTRWDPAGRTARGRCRDCSPSRADSSTGRAAKLHASLRDVSAAGDTFAETAPGLRRTVRSGAGLTGELARYDDAVRTSTRGSRGSLAASRPTAVTCRAAAQPGPVAGRGGGVRARQPVCAAPRRRRAAVGDRCAPRRAEGAGAGDRPRAPGVHQPDRDLRREHPVVRTRANFGEILQAADKVVCLAREAAGRRGEGLVQGALGVAGWPAAPGGRRGRWGWAPRAAGVAGPPGWRAAAVRRPARRPAGRAGLRALDGAR